MSCQSNLRQHLPIWSPNTSHRLCQTLLLSTLLLAVPNRAIPMLQRCWCCLWCCLLTTVCCWPVARFFPKSFDFVIVRRVLYLGGTDCDANDELTSKPAPQSRFIVDGHPSTCCQDGPGRRAGAFKPKSARQRDRREEKQLLKEIESTCPQIKEKFLKLAQSPTGHRLWPDIHSKICISSNTAQVLKNVKELYGVATDGKNSHHMQDVAVLLGRGCDYAFLEEVCGIPTKTMRRYKHTASKRTKLPELITSSYAAGRT